MGLLARLLHGHVASDPTLEQALARAAARVDPRLVHAPHWPGRYRVPLEGALAQARRVAHAVPGPITLDREHWARYPFTHALFPSVEAMEKAIAASPELGAFMASPGVGREVHALLSLRREERAVFGMELDGEVLRRDVPQNVVWFTDPHFLAPAGDEASAREALMWALFDRFLERVAVGVERLRAEQDRLRQEKDLAQARLRAASADKRPGLETVLAKILTNLGEVAHHLDLAHLHEVFETVLSHPQDCLYLEEHAYALDAMGVAGSADPTVASLHFVDLLERYQPPRTVVLTCFPAVSPETLSDRLGQATQWL